jgi:hypothetical protein
MNKVKIVLDADVIIHFSKGGFLSILPDIFPAYDYVILDKVYQEIREPIKSQLDNQIHKLGKLEILKYTISDYLLSNARFSFFCNKDEAYNFI